MVRKTACPLLLLFVAGLTVAAQDAKDAKKEDYPTVIGTFESYKHEILTLKMLKENKEKKFKVPGNTDVGYASGKDKTKVQKAKEHLKDVKKGSFVSITLDKDGKKVLAVGVFVPELPKDEVKGKDEDK
jgi:Icc-related predicted phosphoesterase